RRYGPRRPGRRLRATTTGRVVRRLGTRTAAGLLALVALGGCGPRRTRQSMTKLDSLSGPHFAFGKATLTPEGEAKVWAVATNLNRYPDPPGRGDGVHRCDRPRCANRAPLGAPRRGGEGRSRPLRCQCEPHHDTWLRRCESRGQQRHGRGPRPEPPRRDHPRVDGRNQPPPDGFRGAPAV